MALLAKSENCLPILVAGTLAQRSPIKDTQATLLRFLAPAIAKGTSSRVGTGTSVDVPSFHNMRILRISNRLLLQLIAVVRVAYLPFNTSLGSFKLGVSSYLKL